ncbi:MAG: hypothetical protein KJN81_09185 [Acidimicrobiia bacterium]|nr:hypothetical protein [Acidimicrobiia bacterium]NNL28591.1 hypothetical protein [Acidimicrobiia bacterium]
MDLIEEGYEQSLALMRRAAQQDGFSASPGLDHYQGIWSRDAAITCLGASRTGDEQLVGTVARTLRGMADRMSGAGQIPAVYWREPGYWDWGDAGCVDANAWFVIALADYLDATGDVDTARGLWSPVARVVEWLGRQDANNFGLIDSGRATDWMDSSLSRSGKVLQVNVLYYWCIVRAGEIARALGEREPLDPEGVRERINTVFWPSTDRPLVSVLDHVDYPTQPTRLPHPTAEAGFREAIRDDRGFYLASVEYGRWVDVCDVQANLLAIVSGVAVGVRAELILDYLAAEGVADPFPSKTFPRPIEPDADPWGLFDPESDRLQDPRWRNPPGSYHNGAVWPYIGGFHIAALAKVGRTDEARQMLVHLAQANRIALNGNWGFHEWLRDETGEPSGAPDQAWNAGTYAMAYQLLQDG